MRRRTTLLIARLGVATLVVASLAFAVLVLGRKGSSVPNPPAVLLPGVDLSSHERQVSWEKAARAGIRFIIARATEGDSRKDTAYASIRQEAKAAGLAFTAFHFARPERAHGDAVGEADLFVEAAGLVRGDLAPVLDLEDAGGMREVRLQAWVRAWLEEVSTRVGVKPMIYTNADFWRSHMGDTTEFALAGYPLYVASWDASSPQMPAENWGGRGWTMWQTAKCGRVQGIKGCIRTDFFNGSDLQRLAIP